MSSESPEYAELLTIARDLVVQIDFDGEVAVELCSSLLTEDLDTQLVGAIAHARLVAMAAVLDKNTEATTVARFAMARVVVLLEQQIEQLVSRSGKGPTVT